MWLKEFSEWALAVVREGLLLYQRRKVSLCVIVGSSSLDGADLSCISGEWSGTWGSVKESSVSQPSPGRGQGVSFRPSSGVSNTAFCEHAFCVCVSALPPPSSSLLPVDSH